MNHGTPVTIGLVTHPGNGLSFERYTDRARRAVALADAEARNLGHEEVDTDHLMLGLIAEGEGVAFQVMYSLGITLEAARMAYASFRPPGNAARDVDRPFSDRLRKALELAFREALTLGHNYVGTEHLLLGVVREGSAADVFAALAPPTGEDFHEVVRAKVLELLHGYEKQDAAAATDPAAVSPAQFVCGCGGTRFFVYGTDPVPFGEAVCADCGARARRHPSGE
jgi:ATP-dependent Clp protease ATP-binding subunit ClpC